MFPSAQQKDKKNWIITINSDYVIGRYAVNVDSGQIRLLDVTVRKLQVWP
jgi:hypothetical protein